MDYKLLYIEDLEPNSIMEGFKSQGVEIHHYAPDKFEETLESIGNDVDALVLDFRLTSKEAKFDAPTIAQTIRLKQSGFHKSIPIVLMSSETNITGYYEDSTSQDLFDFAIEKNIFRENPKLYVERLEGYILAYRHVKQERFDIAKILGISNEDYGEMDYRIGNILSHDDTKEDTHAIVQFIDIELVQQTGVLIDEDVLSARLGVDKNSGDWSNLLNALSNCKYNGILNDVYPRWWMAKLETWFLEELGIKSSFRRLTAEKRVEVIKEKTGLSNLNSIMLPEFSKSSKYWNVCLVTKETLDPYDGLEIYRRELLPWQDLEYISIATGLDPESKDKDARKYVKMLKPFSKQKLKNTAEKLNHE